MYSAFHSGVIRVRALVHLFHGLDCRPSLRSIDTMFNVRVGWYCDIMFLVTLGDLVLIDTRTYIRPLA